MEHIEKNLSWQGGDLNPRLCVIQQTYNPLDHHTSQQKEESNPELNKNVSPLKFRLIGEAVLLKTAV